MINSASNLQYVINIRYHAAEQQYKQNIDMFYGLEHDLTVEHEKTKKNYVNDWDNYPIEILVKKSDYGFIIVPITKEAKSFLEEFKKFLDNR